jgi:hypothetical protein
MLIRAIESIPVADMLLYIYQTFNDLEWVDLMESGMLMNTIGASQM